MKSDEIVQSVTTRILTHLLDGVLPWVRPWATDGTLEWPLNPTTGKKYSGFNAFFLNMAQSGFGTNRWLTFAQAQEAGGTVRRGEKGTPALRPLEIKKAFQNAAEGEQTAETLLLFRGYTVFNLSQCDGLDHLRPAATTTLNVVQRSPRIDAAIAATGATIRHGGNECYYRPSDDMIQMVEPERFTGMSEYYATALHELVHWTGHKTRLNRDASTAFKSHSYAKEELVAELGAAFACQALGIDGIDRHQASYIQNWITVLQEEPGVLLKVTGAAKTAFQYLLPEGP